MLGRTGLRRSGALPTVVRQQGPGLPRFARSISSFRTQSSRLPALNTTGTRPLAGKFAGGPPSSVAGPTCLRFNSTSSAATTQSGSTSTGEWWPDPSVTPDVPDFSSVDVSTIPEKLGYLKELGLSYGYGPTSIMEWIIEHIHIFSGLPWGASIVATGVVTRLVFMKFAFDAADNAAKSINIKPKTGKLEAKLNAVRFSGDHVKIAPVQAELSHVRKQHGVIWWKPIVPMLQIPLSFGSFRIVEGMSRLPVPGLASESFGWIHDLTVADPFYILPLVASGALYMSLKAGGEQGAFTLATPGLGTMRIVMPALSLVFMSFMPGALQLYFTTTNLIGLCQATALKSDSFRRAMGITVVDRGIANAAASRELRLMVDEISAQREVAEREQNLRTLSMLDRVLDSFKTKYENAKNSARDFQKDAETKSNSMFGGAKRADGSNADPPRLSEKDRKLADEYERRRFEEEEFKRQERNADRRSGSNESTKREE